MSAICSVCKGPLLGGYVHSSCAASEHPTGLQLEPTLIQRNVEKYFNELPEKWNVDGTLKGDFDSSVRVTFPKAIEGQTGWLLNNVQYVPVSDSVDLCGQ